MDTLIETACDQAAIKLAFSELRRTKGTVARMAFWCCSSCAWADLEDRVTTDDTVVFYNQQAADAFEAGTLVRDLYMQWQGDRDRIAYVLGRFFGDRVVVPENADTTFIIKAAS